MTWQQLRAARVRVGDHVAHRTLAQEMVLLNVRTSTYYTVDEVGARFFETIRTARTLEAASEALAAEYEQPVERIVDDLTTFCQQMLERDLIEVEVTG